MGYNCPPFLHLFSNSLLNILNVSSSLFVKWILTNDLDDSDLFLIAYYSTQSNNSSAHLFLGYPNIPDDIAGIATEVHKNYSV